MKNFFDFTHPFYRPLWRRVALVGFCLLWALFELSNNAPFWALIFGGVGLMMGYEFFLKPRKPPASDDHQGDSK